MKAVDGVRGVYIHGSAVLGDWDERRSDVDVLVLASDDSASAASAYAAVMESIPTWYCTTSSPVMWVGRRTDRRQAKRSDLFQLPSC